MDSEFRTLLILCHPSHEHCYSRSRVFNRTLGYEVKQSIIQCLIGILRNLNVVECHWRTIFFILLNFYLNSHTWLVAALFKQHYCRQGEPSTLTDWSDQPDGLANLTVFLAIMAALVRGSFCISLLKSYFCIPVLYLIWLLTLALGLVFIFLALVSLHPSNYGFRMVNALLVFLDLDLFSS